MARARPAAPALVSQKEIARLIKRSTQQVANLVTQGMPRLEKDGKWLYPVTECLLWFGRKQGADEARREKPKNRTDVLNRKLLAEVQLAEMDLAQREGQLVTLEYLETQVAGICQRVRAVLLSVPGKWAPALVGCKTVPDAMTRLRPAVHEVLEALAEVGEDAQLDEDGAPRAA
jgi:phage terminase Nu1 subunit (DNA packaging protein)